MLSIVTLVQRPPGLSQGPLSSTPVLTQTPPLPHGQQQGNAQQPYSPHVGSDPLTRPPPGLQGHFVRTHQLGLQGAPGSTSQQGSTEMRYGEVQVLGARQPKQHLRLDHDAGLQTAGSSGWEHDLSRFNPDAGTEAAQHGTEAQHAQQQAGFRFGQLGSSTPAQHAQQPAALYLGHSSSGMSAQHAQQPGINQTLGSLRIDDQTHSPSEAMHGMATSSQQYSAGDHHDNGHYGSADNGSGVVYTDKPQLGSHSQHRQIQRPYEPHKQPASLLYPQDASQSPGSRQSPFHDPLGFLRNSQGSQSQPQGLPHQAHGPQSQPQGFQNQSQSQSQGFSRDHAQPQLDGWDAPSSSLANDEQWQVRNEHPQGQAETHRQGSIGMPDRTPSGRVLTVPRQAPGRSQLNRPKSDRVGAVGVQDESHQSGAAPNAGLAGDEVGPSLEQGDDVAGQTMAACHDCRILLNLQGCCLAVAAM